MTAPLEHPTAATDADRLNNASTAGQSEKDSNNDPRERWKRRAEQLAKCVVTEIEHWKSQPLLGIRGSIITTESTQDTCTLLDNVNRCFGGTCDDISNECEICKLRRRYNDAVQQLLTFLHQQISSDHPSKETSATETNTELDAATNEQLFALQRELLKLREASFKTEVLLKAKDVKSQCDIIHERLGKIFQSLLMLCNNFKNGTSSKLTTLKRKRSLQDDESLGSAKKVCFIPPKANIFLTEHVLFERFPSAEILLDYEADVITTLDEFERYVEYGFENVTIGTAVETTETVDLILGWERGKGMVAFKLESLVSHELKASQEIIYTIMFKIAFILKIETQITNEQETELFGTLPKQIDDVIGCVCQHLRVARLHTCVVPIEIKALKNANTEYGASQAKVVDQVIGSLATSLMSAFCFGGVGADCKVRGAVFSLVSVEILELELKDAGTSNARLIFRTSGNQPLFGEKATNTLLQNSTAFKDIFPDYMKGATQGWELLAELMLPVKHSLVFPCGDAVYKESRAKDVAVKSYLGSGTYGTVYELKEKDSFIKVPKEYEYIKGFEDEMKTLRALNDARIPKAAAELGRLEAHLRCETSVLQCLRLEGYVGESASSFNFGSIMDIVHVCCEVYEALNHAHGEGIAHLDVRPSNIIVSGRHRTENKNNLRVQLIDWGLACSFGDELHGFRGCLPYAHDELLTATCGATWSPAPKHDLASLAYTLTTLMFRMEVGSTTTPWCFEDDITAALEARRTVVETYLAKLNVAPSDDVLPALLGKLLTGAGIKVQETATLRQHSS